MSHDARALPTLLIAVLTLTATACDGPPEEKVAGLAPLVLQSMKDARAGDLSALVNTRSSVGPIRVYVDRSLTIAPYDRSGGSPFGQLLSRFDDWIAGEVAFSGFGFAQRSDAAQGVIPASVQELMNPGSYSFANNDYGSLFQSFAPGDTTRVVITDGVQSDPLNQARLSTVTTALHHWVSRGGAFATLIFRNRYEGTYYSDLEEPGARRYACPDRPLLVFVLAPSLGAVDDLLARLQPLRPAHVIRIGGANAVARPAPETLPTEPGRRGDRVLRKVQRAELNGFAPIHTAVVSTRTGAAAAGYVPLQFEVVAPLGEYPWKGLGIAGTRQFLADTRPELTGWTADAGSRRRGGGKDARPGLTAVTLDSRQAGAPTLQQKGDSIVARYTLPLRRPATDAREVILLFTLHPGESASRQLVPAGYTTDDDRAASACSRTLKLERLLSAAVLRNYIPARSLLVTQWR
jgi:hypothetical protein